MAEGQVLLFVLLIFQIVFGWNGYERPIRLANQQLDGPFEWELRVEHILTMSALREHDEYSIHDFEPNSMAWIERDKDQLKGCLQNLTLLAAFDPQNGTKLMGLNRWIEQSERALSSLIQFNGRHQRLWGVNDQIPGPTLIAIEGTEVHLRIKNRLLMESLTIHLHGLTLPSKWYFDGVAPIQQCPIAVKSDFAFHFRATTAGTHWYHGQFPDGHQSNGLLGPLIVLPKGGIKEDRDFVAILQDWPKIGTEEQEENWAEGIVNENNEMNDDGIWSILVNQKGWHDRREIVQKPSKIPWTRFPIGKDEKIRLRLIHGGYRHPLVLHIEGHKMELIASDGTDLQPKKVDALIIYPGERFDVRIQTLANPRHSIYRIVVEMAEQFLTNNPKNPIYGLAELEYDGNGNGKINVQQKVDFKLYKCASRNCTIFGCPFQHPPMVNSTFNVGDGRKFACVQLVELKKKKLPEKNGQNETLVDIDEKHVIAIDPFSQTVDGFNFQMPNSTFEPFFLGGGQMKNVLNALNCSNCAVKPCKCFYYKRFAKGRRVQITFVNQNGPKNGSTSSNFSDLFRQSFSIHLHGIKFNVLKIGYSTLNFADGNVQLNWEMEKCKSNEDCKAFSADFPIKGMEMQKDTVLVPFGGYTTILFNADNPGWWIAETQQKGRGSVKFAFAIGEDEEMPKPPMNFPSDCGTFEPGTGIYEQFLA